MKKLFRDVFINLIVALIIIFVFMIFYGAYLAPQIKRAAYEYSKYIIEQQKRGR